MNDATPEGSAQGLHALEAEVRRDLARLNYPAAAWLPGPETGPDAAADPQADTDVLVVGGGMCGQTVAYALLREGVKRVRVLDRNPVGLEGPWATFARMETLRSPKHLTGPDLGVTSLTFRAWYEALHGAAGWEALYKIPRLDWADYVLWVRKLLALPVENDSEVLALEPGPACATAPGGALVRARIRTPQGESALLARKVVLALGRDGSGAPRWPRFASFDPASRAAQARVFHSADTIDFEALRGRRVAVLGAGASGFDNAGTALEAGAAEVRMYARRPYLPQVNKSKWTSFPGFLRGFVGLDDARRWRFFTYIFSEQVPPPFESVLRCDRQAAFSLHLGEAWTDLAPDAEGVTVRTARGEWRCDAAIVATGFDVNLMDRSELAAFRAHTLLWQDRVSAQEAAKHPEEARFPYLGEGFELRARDAQAPACIGNLHIFNWGCTMSHGALAGDVPGLAIGANRLAEALVKDLFVAEADRLWAQLLAHSEEELKTTRRYVPPGER